MNKKIQIGLSIMVFFLGMLVGNITFDNKLNDSNKKALTDNSSAISTATPIDTVSQEEKFWDTERERAKEAKEYKIGYAKAYKKMEDFCGVGNVWAGSPGWDTGDGYSKYGIFGCEDYSKVK